MRSRGVTRHVRSLGQALVSSAEHALMAMSPSKQLNVRLHAIGCEGVRVDTIRQSEEGRSHS